MLAALLVAVFAGFLGVASELGWRRLSVQVAVTAQALAVVLWLLAALINGFVAPAVAASTAASTATLELCHRGNQVLAEAGALALAASILAWSSALAGRGRLANVVAGLGALAGAAPAAFLLSGHLQLDVDGMLALVLAEVAWNLCVALWLGRRPRVEAPVEP